MKTLIAALITVFTVSANATSILPHGAIRPIQGAEMTVLKKSGNFSDVEEVNLLQVRFSGTRELGFLVNFDDRSMAQTYVVTETEEGSCGETIYTAVPQVTQRPGIVTCSFTSMRVVDYSTGICPHYKLPGMWVMTISTMGMADGELTAYGNPEPVR